MKLQRILCSAALLAAIAGCGPATPPAGTDMGPPPDLTRPPMACKDNSTCSGQTAICDVTSGKCVQCVKDGDCPMGQVCKANACVPSEILPDLLGADLSVVPGVDMAMPGGDDAGGGACDDGKPCIIGGMGMAMGICCNKVCLDTSADKANCGACGKACGGGEACCTGACVDTMGDAKNCGACGTACDFKNATGSCTAGKCALAKCNDGFGDCDMLANNGCEVDLNADPLNCLGCGNTCAAAHGVAGCAKGCTVGKCDVGFGDCDNSYGNGCEVDLTTSLANCGKCAMGCGNVMNGSPACVAGVCGVSGCNGSFLDCNMMGGDGCEADASKDPANCGKCGMACPAVPNAMPGCTNGVCGAGACNQGFQDCNKMGGDGCEADTAKDPKNCGGCGVNCPAVANAVVGCAAGKCVIASCTMGFADCNNTVADGCEVDTRSDVKNCSKCMMVCSPPMNGAVICENSACKQIPCGPTAKDCNGIPNDGCEVDISTDVANCGACAKVCPNIANGVRGCANSTCGIKACNAPFKDCNMNVADGCEVDSSKDINNCNVCGTKCAVANGTPGCTNGTCGIAACNAGFKDCKNGYMDGCETNVNTDLANCGACGAICKVTNGTPACNVTCNIGACNAGFADCKNANQDGCETATISDVNNCGGCAKVCAAVANGTAGCSNSKCVVGSCNAPFKDCDANVANGCEINTNSDAKNCGGCGIACPMGVACNGGTCKDKVLLVVADSLAYRNDVQAKLLGTGAFAGVDIFDAATKTAVLADLKPYQAILVWSNQQFLDKVALGNAVADYFDQGGRVVIAVFADTSGWKLSGRWETGLYHLIGLGNNVTANETGIKILEANSPLMAGVANITSSTGYKSDGAAVNGGIAVANWATSGKPIVIRGTKNGRALAMLNMFPPSAAVIGGGWVGDGANLMRNALLYKINSYGPSHTFAGLTTDHYITQGCCGVSCQQVDATNADYFCKHFYFGNCVARAGFTKHTTPNGTYPKMHKNGGCTSQGSDIPGKTCDNGPCKVGNWNEVTSGLNNLICDCP